MGRLFAIPLFTIARLREVRGKKMALKSVKTCLVEIVCDPRAKKQTVNEAVRLLRLYPPLEWVTLVEGRPRRDSEKFRLGRARRAALSEQTDPKTRLESIRYYVAHVAHATKKDETGDEAHTSRHFS